MAENSQPTLRKTSIEALHTMSLVKVKKAPTSHTLHRDSRISFVNNRGESKRNVLFIIHRAKLFVKCFIVGFENGSVVMWSIINSM